MPMLDRFEFPSLIFRVVKLNELNALPSPICKMRNFKTTDGGRNMHSSGPDELSSYHQVS